MAQAAGGNAAAKAEARKLFEDAMRVSLPPQPQDGPTADESELVKLITNNAILGVPYYNYYSILRTSKPYSNYQGLSFSIVMSVRCSPARRPAEMGRGGPRAASEILDDAWRGLLLIKDD